MPTKFYTKHNFNAGEFSSRLQGRQDVDKYANALDDAKNCMVTAHGSIKRRNGTKFIKEVKDSSKTVRLIPFIFSQDDALVLEFGDLYIRFFKDGGNVESSGSPLEVTTPYSQTDVQDISYVQFGNFLYLVHSDHAPRILKRTSDTVWTLELLNAFPPPTYEAGYAPATTVTPGATTGTGVTFTAGAASFVEGDIGRQIQNLAGTGRASIVAYTSTTSVDCDIVEDFPDTNPIASGDWKLDLSPVTDLTPNGTKQGSIINITSDEPDSVNPRAAFGSQDVGKYILMHNGVVQITTINSGSDIDAEVLKSLDSKDETANWSLEVETWNDDRGYPSAVGLYQERLVFGGTTAQPQTLWFSETGVLDSFGTGSEDSDSIEVTISSSQANRIQWMATLKDLVVGTSGSESTIKPLGTSGLTPTDITQTPRTYYGSSVQQPIVAENEAIFYQGSKRKIRTFRFDFNVDSYIGEDLTFLAEHITEGNIKEMAFSQEPDNIILAVLENGKMVVGTYKRVQKVIGWCEWSTSGSFENVASIPAGAFDDVWVVVKRTIDGSTKRYIELLDTGDGTDRLDGFSDSFLTYSDPKAITGATQADPVVITSTSHGYSNGDTIKIIDVVGMTELNGKTYLVANKTANTFELTDTDGNDIDGTGYTAYSSGGEAHELVNTISGLDHLEGETVQVKTDGASHPDETVSSGSITLDRSSYEVTVGLSYTTTITTLDIHTDFGNGEMSTRPQRWVRPAVRVVKSYPPLLSGQFLPSRSGADEMDEATPLFTGIYEYSQMGWANDSTLSLTFSDPFPLHILSISGKLEGGND